MKNKHYLALAKFIPEQLNSKGGAGITMSSPLLKDQLLAYPVLVCFNITFYRSPLYITKTPNLQPPQKNKPTKKPNQPQKPNPTTTTTPPKPNKKPPNNNNHQ